VVADWSRRFPELEFAVIYEDKDVGMHGEARFTGKARYWDAEE
jgi:hypothetical protein